jgi:hypothetical protein
MAFVSYPIRSASNWAVSAQRRAGLVTISDGFDGQLHQAFSHLASLRPFP